MSMKQTVVLLVAALVLLALVFLSQQREKATVEEARSPMVQLMAGVTSNTVERIEIAPAEGTSVTLTKRDSVWYVNPARQWKADKNHMTQMFNNIEKEITGEVVSTNKSNHVEYQVNESSATRVRLYGSDDKLLEDLLVGKAGASFTSTFVRKIGKDEVLNANAALSYTFNKPEGWRDKTVFDIQSATITGLECEGTSGTWTAAKSGEKWRLNKPQDAEVQSDKLQPVINTVATLRAVDFAETTQSLAELGLDPPKQKITVQYEDRVSSPPKPMSSVLLIGNKNLEKENYYAKRPDSDVIYMIAAYMANTLTPNPADLQVAKPVVVAKATTATAAAPADETTTAPAADETKAADAVTTSAAVAKPAAPAEEAEPAVASQPKPADAPSTAAAEAKPAQQASETSAAKTDPAKIVIQDVQATTTK